MRPRPTAPADSPSLLRRMNSAHVLEVIRERGPISRAQLARETGLSKPTVNEVVERLLDATYVEEAAPADGLRPRRPGPRGRLLRFRADLGHVVGVDIGADTALALVADLSGRILARERRAVSGQARAGQDPLLREVRATARAALRAAGLGADGLRAVGVGTPGVVDPASGRITLAPQLAGWEGLALGPRLQRTFGCPVVVDNETHVSLLAETWRGAAQDVRDAVYVQVGVGIGGAVLVNGELYRGATGAAGEIGYLAGDGDGAPEHGAGPFEWAAGARAYARLGARAAARPRAGALLRELAGGDPAAVTAQTVFAAAALGDAAAQEVVTELTRRLARGVAGFVTALNPELVIVGGGVANAGSALLEPLEAGVRALVPVPPRIELSRLGDESVALGAVRLAADVADASLFPLAADAAS